MAKKPDGAVDVRIPPYNADAERAVLGAILLDNQCLAVAAAIAQPEDFYCLPHRVIFETMLEVRRAGQAVDAVTVGNALIGHGRLEQVGGAAVFVQLTDAIATTTNVEHYARIVKGHAAVRAVIAAATGIAARGYSDVGELDEYLADARSQMIAASAVHVQGGPRPIGEGLYDLVKEASSGKPPEGMLATHFRTVDEVSGGLWSGLLHVVGGRPKMGKSTLLLNMALNMALAGRRVLYVTLEDTVLFQRRRALARLANLNLMDIALNRVRRTEVHRLLRAAEQLAALPVKLDDSPMDANQIGHKATVEYNGGGLDLLIVDHLSYVKTAHGQDGKEYDTVSANTRSFALLAKALNIPVVLAVQLSRKVEERPNKRPMLSDLRGSGHIEQDARVIWFVYRDEVYNPTATETPGVMELIMAKCSHGPEGIVQLACDMPTMWVHDRDVPREGPPGAAQQQSFDY